MRRAATLLLLALTQGPHGSSAKELHPDITAVIKVTGDNPKGLSWADSYSVGNSCYCSFSTFDHGIKDFMVKTPLGWMTVEEICDELGPGPGMNETTPLYNDVQCGNGPPNDAGDEHTCPGRVDMGPSGCGQIGPMWDFLPLLPPALLEEIQDNSTDSEMFKEPVSSFPEALFKISFGANKLSEGTDKADEKKILSSGLISSFSGLGVDIEGTTKDVAYGSNIWATGMVGYAFDVDPLKTYVVKIGLAESWASNCQAGMRRFNLFVGQNQILPDVDAYMMAGNKCQHAYNIIVANVKPSILGSLVIKAQKGSRGNPFLSLVEVAEQPKNYRL